jgi:hypothetical protein
MLSTEKGWGIGQIVREFTGIVWNRRSGERLICKRFEALDQFQGRNVEVAGLELPGQRIIKPGISLRDVEEAIAFLRKMRPGLIKHKEKLPRNSMSIKCLYPNC